MKDLKVYLFWSPKCGFCPPAKDMIHELHSERKDFDLLLMSEITPNINELVKEFNVESTPTFVIQGPGYPDNIGLRGMQSKKVMNKYLDVAMGKKQLEQPKGWFNKVFGL